MFLEKLCAHIWLPIECSDLEEIDSGNIARELLVCVHSMQCLWRAETKIGRNAIWKKSCRGVLVRNFRLLTAVLLQLKDINSPVAVFPSLNLCHTFKMFPLSSPNTSPCQLILRLNLVCSFLLKDRALLTTSETPARSPIYSECSCFDDFQWRIVHILSNWMYLLSIPWFIFTEPLWCSEFMYVSVWSHLNWQCWWNSRKSGVFKH